MTPLLFISFLISCAPEKPRKEVELYNTYCASCHIAPKIDELPKDIWKNAVLPDMASRMEIEEMYQDTNEIKSGFRPKIKLKEWVQIQNYVIQMAPEKLDSNKIPKLEPLTLFKSKEMALDEQNGAFITYLGFAKNKTELFYGDISGKLNLYNFKDNSQQNIFSGKTPITWYSINDSLEVFTEVGILDPSELQRGKLTMKKKDTFALQNNFYRPVHTLLEDLNGNNKKELVVSEFGDETGRLSLLTQTDSMTYDKTVLINLPGCIRTLAKDMDKDGKTDLVTITSQGNESITILYQTQDLKFRAEKVLEFSPVYGTSWFELVDYNGDGLDDIITVNGDNADKSYVHKPYHGMRIHLNNGDNTFTESYFYPLNGATRVVARDFDQDGDMDFGLISTFPDYENAPELSFVYLENNDAKNFKFSTQTLKEHKAGRWFLMDTSDIDNDGDEDIVLSAFSYVFTPVPEAYSKQWSENNVDILVLENKLK
ncbi:MULTISPECIES: FG-GAP repeat domain-containing protein [Flavobacteriaceae]|uniref:FG-GAP repeat domain-containing protein n=1 Tax=Flavobacteriaceae TaxID=49546 RepID=UPI001490D7BE|nr:MULTISPECIES: VCBS repeat-containing protein [Allomuricauda]MDC6364655.1 VCBS repeat-containing protein [Muricauda sp. AC10]